MSTYNNLVASEETGFLVLVLSTNNNLVASPDGRWGKFPDWGVMGEKSWEIFPNNGGWEKG